MYKLISTDLDGTLIPFLGTITEETSEIVKDLLEKGVLIVPNSGRCLGALDEKIMECKFRYLICANGSYVLDTQNNKAIYEAYVENKKAADIFDFLMTFNEAALVFIDNVFVSDTKMKINNDNSPYSFMSDTITYYDDLPQKIRNGFGHIQKLVIRCHSDKRLHYQELIKSRFPDVNCTSSGKENIEISDHRATKDTALIKLCEYLKINLDEVIVMGDNDNDLSVLSLGCYNIVPSNGNDNAKKTASIITDSCENGGPIKEIKKMYEEGKIV